MDIESEKKWIEIKHENAPPKRSRHTSVLYNNKLWIFGGYSVDNKVFNDLFTFDLESHQWTEIKTQNPPNPLKGHTAVVYNDQMYIFGGSRMFSEGNAINVFDFKSHTWNKIETQEQEVPPIRHYHTAVVWNDRMWIYGGFHWGSSYNDMWTFNFTENKWNQINQKGDIPPGRGSHIATVYYNNMYMHGGLFDGTETIGDFYRFDFLTETWFKIEPKGTIPLPRESHACVIYNNKLITFAGFHRKTGNYDDMFQYDFIENKWEQIKTRSQNPQKRDDFSMDLKDNIIYIFGGVTGYSDDFSQRDDYANFSDVFQFHIEKDLYSDLRIFLERGELSDINFETQDGIKFHAHSTILQSRLKNWKFNPQTFSKICSNYSSKTIEQLLKYLYYEKFELHLSPKELELRKELIDISKLLELKELETLCEGKYLQLTKENIILKDLYNLYLNEETKNFSIISNQQKIKVHRDILIMRSELFRGLFMSVQEDSNEVEDLSGLTTNGLKEFLYFLYNDEIGPDININIICELFGISDYFGMSNNKLDEICEEFLKKQNIPINKLLELLEKSVQFERHDFIDYISELCYENLKEIKELPEFEEFQINNEDLVQLISQKPEKRENKNKNKKNNKKNKIKNIKKIKKIKKIKIAE
ncbi:leucine-zipper-like transcriptional regulator 1 [Anaeramoeba ignava]|uniref:Leucine-zipper-like transcriptional regulator 1 n=1 Tax=Anaeramoeba ignava TaxID=1746090 RepID=A0A9Q0RH06_ANAIG|nr:leucine-zipper-like transcriptional regulator 1 [Anaeramoeba ignava]